MPTNLYRRSSLNNEYSTKQFNITKKQVTLANCKLAYCVIDAVYNNKLALGYNRIFLDAFFIFLFQKHTTKLNSIAHKLFKVLYRFCFSLLNGTNTTIMRYKEHFTKVLNFIKDNNKKKKSRNNRNVSVKIYNKKNVIKQLGNRKIEYFQCQKISTCFLAFNI